ncbi:MAG: SDR family oxidoreductase [Deltaproteobacteria bacterium]|nr:SDR family oxidoreductase [Deltaproteobacteria bacterium]
MKRSIDRDLRADLSGRVALVTGGTGSIGEEIAIALRDSGTTVAVAGRSKKTISPKLGRRLGADKRMTYFPADMGNEESVRSLARTFLREHGQIDILVLAHGIQLRKPFRDFSWADWNDIVGTNLGGTFLACKYFASPMIERRRGRIIGITSLTAEYGIRNISAYAASKGGMAQFLKSLAVELARYNVTVNMVAPGRIVTRMTRDLMGEKRLKDSGLGRIPMGRFGRPSDISGAVLYLASEAAGYVTGQTIVVDGGWTTSMGNPKA